MTAADYLILLGLGAGVWLSWTRGFFVESIDLVKWSAASWLAVNFWPAMDAQLVGLLAVGPPRMIAAMVLLFAGTLLFFWAFKIILAEYVTWPPLRFTDRLLGSVFGFAKGSIIFVGLILATALTALPEKDFWKQSILIQRTLPTAKAVVAQLPTDLQRWFRW